MNRETDEALGQLFVLLVVLCSSSFLFFEFFVTGQKGNNSASTELMWRQRNDIIKMQQNTVCRMSSAACRPPGWAK